MIKEVVYLNAGVKIIHISMNLNQDTSKSNLLCVQRNKSDSIFQLYTLYLQKISQAYRVMMFKILTIKLSYM